MAEKRPSNSQLIEATRNAEAYFEDTKNRGKILVNAGKITKEDYYKKIREENKDFLEEVEKEQKVLDIGLKESRRAKKERLDKLKKND